MTQQEREQAARAIFKTYEEEDTKLSKIGSKARELVRKVDGAIEDDEKKFCIAAAASIYQELEKIEGAKRVAQQVIKLVSRARIDGMKPDFGILTNRLVSITRDAKGYLERIEYLMRSFE